MFVCICNQVTDRQIRQSVAEGVNNFEALAAELKVATCCGKCKNCANKVLREALLENQASQAVAFVHSGGAVLSPA